MISTPSHIQKPYAVVIGGANMDIYGSANEDIRLKDSNPGRVTTSPGGVARNIAENLAKLEVSCHLIAAVGNDLYGDKIIQHAKTAGINVEHILRVGDANTSTYLSVLDNDNDTMVAISDMDIVDHLTPKKLKSHDKLIKQAAVIVADTNLSEEALHYLSDRCFGQPLFVDTVSAAKACRIKPFLKSVHTLKTNRLEAETISAMPASKNDNMAQMAKWFHDQGVKRLFITLGPDGVFYSDGDKHGIKTIKPKTIVNTSGAGDAFVAGLTYGWLEGFNLMNTVQFSLSSANVALSHRGTINPEMSVGTVNTFKETNNNE